MNRFIFISLCLFITVISAPTLVAQGKEFKNAEEAFKKGDFPRALQNIQIVLGTPEQLKGDNLPKAYLLRAKTYINLLTNAVKANNQAEITQNQDAFIFAYQDVLKAQELTKTEALKKEIKDLSNVMYSGLLQGGSNFLNAIFEINNTGNSHRQELLDEAQKYLMAALKLKPDSYLAHDFYAQVMMLKRDKESALQHFNASKKYYLQQLPAKPNFDHFKVYDNIAILHMQDRQADSALLVLEIAKNNIESEWKRAANPDENTQKAYKMAKENIEILEMDIYLNIDGYLPQALQKFQKAVDEKPADYSLRIAYGQLLEKNKESGKALAEYQAAAAIDSTALLAWYNIGAIYINEGLEMHKAIESTELPDKGATEKMQTTFRKALSALETAHKIDGKDLPTLEALLMVCGRLEMKEAYINYRNLKKSLEK